MVAYLNRNDPDHACCAELFEQRDDQLWVTVADSSVVALAERLKAPEVVTLDRRHFLAISPEHVEALTLLP